MPVTGAIFDCDGTLVDSMRMWGEVTVRCLERHGVEDAWSVFEKTEHMGLGEECDWYHEHLGIGASGEALTQEVYRMVEWAYGSTVRAFPRCRDFLRELHEAGIPMVCASSTPTELVRVALRTHGMAEYFSHVICTDEVGAGKEKPDVYLRALELLSTDLDSTWVFEDAPFGVRTAHQAGFHTVCLFNDHDGRDEDFLRQNCDIFAHGYGELSLALLRDFADRRDESHAPESQVRVLVVDGSPQPSSPDLVARLAGESDYVIAVDRGAEVLYAAGATPDVFCGDADSVSRSVAEWAHAAARTDLRFTSEKYDTDLGLAIACARHEAARRDARLELTLTCATGGRPDHALAVLGLAAANADARPRIVEDGCECRILSPAGSPVWVLRGCAGKTFSAVALREGTVVSEQGMRWNLDHRGMDLLGDLGISNVVAGDEARVECHEGVVAAYLIGE